MGIKGDKKQLGKYLSGMPMEIPDANVLITQPKIKDIIAFGEEDFFSAVKILTDIDSFGEAIKRGNSQLNVLSNFQLLLIVMSEDFTIKQLISKLFELIFPDYVIQITENSIDFIVEDKEQDLKILVGKIHPFNFENFQILLNDLFLPQISDDEPEYNPANEAANKIMEKIKRGREKVRAQKAAAEGEKSSSLFTLYLSILSVGMRMDINIFLNYTCFQLYDSFKRYFSKIASDYFMRLQSMPFMDTSKSEAPPDWARNLY